MFFSKRESGEKNHPLQVYFNIFFENLDIIAGLLGILLGISILVLSFLKIINQSLIGFTILCSCLVYFYIRKYLSDIDNPISILTIIQKLILNILFFSLLSLSLIIWYMQSFHRPFIYFFIVSSLAGLISIEILFHNNQSRVWPIIVKIFLIAFTIRGGIFYNFPSIMGYDAYFHTFLANEISTIGFVPSVEIGRNYAFTPLLHIFIALQKIVCSVDIKDAITISIGIVSVISLIFIYLIVKEILGYKIGLFTLLLGSLLHDFIITGIANITAGSLVFCYFCLMLYIIYKSNSNVFDFSFLAFFAILTVLTHQLSTFVVLIIMIFYYMSILIYRFAYLKSAENKIKLELILMYMIFLIFYWSISDYTKNYSVFEAVVSSAYNILQYGGNFDSNVLIIGQTQSSLLIDTILLQIPYLLLPFFSITGTLILLKNKKSNTFSLAFIIGILYVLVYGIPLLGIRDLLSSRWMPILDIFLIIAASYFIYTIVVLFKTDKKKCACLFIIFFSIAFIMITTSAVDKDNPLVTSNTLLRNQFTTPEIFAAEKIGAISVSNVYVDSTFSIAYQLYRSIDSLTNNRGFDSQVIIIDVASGSKTTFNSDDIIVLRKSSIIQSIFFESNFVSSNISPESKSLFDNFPGEKFNLIYNNNQVRGYNYP